MERLSLLICGISSFAILLAIGERIEIVRIHTSSDRTYLNFSTLIHSNRTRFDLTATVLRQLRLHDLIMNMRLKAKAVNGTHYSTIYSWNRIDVCKFLLNYEKDVIFKYIHANARDSILTLRCPIHEGNYAFKNFALVKDLPRGSLTTGTYKFFCEVAQASGEVVKVFAFQIVTEYFDD